MAQFKFISDAGIQLPEIKQKGAHTAYKSRKEQDREDHHSNNDAAERLAQQAHEQGLDVKGLTIGVEDQTVHLSGTAATQELKEKLILLVGNIQGISKVEEHVQVKHQGEESHFHTVTREDSLKLIAEKYLESSDRYPEIIEANDPFIIKEKDLYPGMVIRIPSLEKK